MTRGTKVEVGRRKAILRMATFAVLFAAVIATTSTPPEELEEVVTPSPELVCSQTGACSIPPVDGSDDGKGTAGSGPFLNSSIAPFDDGFASMRLFMKYSLHNVAFINGTLHFYGISSEEAMEEFEHATRVRGRWKLMTRYGMELFRPEWVRHAEPLDRSWCEREGEWVDEDVLLFHPWIINNFFHLFNNVFFPLYYNILFSRFPSFNPRPLFERVQPGHVSTTIHEELLDLYTQPRRVYRLDDAERYPGISHWDRNALSMIGAISHLFRPDPDTGEWFHSGSNLVNGVVCMKHFRWGEALQPFESYYFPFHEGWHGIVHEFTKTVFSQYDLSPLSTLASESRPNILFMSRGCRGNGRCLLNRDALLPAIEKEFGTSVSVESCCDYSDVKGTLSRLQSADIIIGLHGANLAGLFFMRPGGLVVELKGFKGKRSLLFRYEAFHVGVALILFLSLPSSLILSLSLSLSSSLPRLTHHRFSIIPTLLPTGKCYLCGYCCGLLPVQRRHYPHPD